MKKEESKKTFGLIGKNISYSFSREYFSNKFKNLGLKNYQYLNFDLQDISDFHKVLKKNKQELKGLNITIPYKVKIFDFLDKIDSEAKKIGAVNTVKFTKNGKLIGFNTDAYGFKKSLQPLLQKYHKSALILGTGGASKAVAHVFKQLGINFKIVSRTKQQSPLYIMYKDLNKIIINSNLIIVNCTPLGTYPEVEKAPSIPYNYITNKHLLYDLIYNPAHTSFLEQGKKNNALTVNGLEMLKQQAEKAWEIWNI
ncbi:MAG: shikimate dehydrogenase family protein [Tenacibaculum sp.]